MENLGLDIFYELTHYLHPQDFARLRVALPRLNAFFNPTYIIRHILQKSNQQYRLWSYLDQIDLRSFDWYSQYLNL